MKSITKYITNDGIEFQTEEAAKLYELITTNMDKMLEIQPKKEQYDLIYYVSCYAQKMTKE
jgi:hypothetical protein